MKRASLALVPGLVIVGWIAWSVLAARQREAKETKLLAACYNAAGASLLQKVGQSRFGEPGVRLGVIGIPACVDYVNALLADPDHRQETQWLIEQEEAVEPRS